MIDLVLNRVRSFRKTRYLQNGLYSSKKKYAFIGMGMHSLTNLYPILRHYAIALKYICTKQSPGNDVMQKLFPGSRFTHSIDDIANDREVEGIFVSAAPGDHFTIALQLLTAGKKIFIEKPPCESREELERLIAVAHNAVCKVGLQRRYWPGTKIVLRKLKTAKSYTYRFQTGPYVDSDMLTGLFIHPLDYILYLFGSAHVASHSHIKHGGGTTLQLHLLHDRGVSGLIECSTHYSWNNPTDDLQVNCSNEILSVQYPHLLEGELKPSRIMNIPAERILNQVTTKKEYFSTKNLILPVAELNSLYFQGFYSEMETFINIVEYNDSSTIQNDLAGLVPLYQIFDVVRKT